MSSEVEMSKALHDIIRLVEGWVDSDATKAEATMLKILNTMGSLFKYTLVREG